MLYARASMSSGDSPASKAVESSARRVNALNTSPHFPQRTWPPAARSTSADSLNTVSHFEHCVNNLSASPSVDTAPVIALDDLHHIKPTGVSGFYLVRLGLQKSGQEQIPAWLAGGCEFRRQFDQGARKNVGHDTVGRAQAAVRAGAIHVDTLNVDVRGNAVANRIVAGREQRLGIQIDRRHVGRPQFQRGNPQDARAAAVIDDVAAVDGQ